MPITERPAKPTLVVDCDHCEARLLDSATEADDFYDLPMIQRHAKRQGWTVTRDQQVICPSDDAEHHDAIDRAAP